MAKQISLIIMKILGKNVLPMAFYNRKTFLQNFIILLELMFNGSRSISANSLYSVSNSWILLIYSFNTGNRFNKHAKDFILNSFNISGFITIIQSKTGSSKINLFLMSN